MPLQHLTSGTTMFLLKLSLLTLLIAAHGLLISAETSVTCEGSTASLSCGVGVLTIDSANYGRTCSETCSAGPLSIRTSNTDCYATKTLTTVKQICEGKTSCIVPASNSLFSDPCVNTYKYLSIRYFCNTETSVTCEGSTNVLTCETGVLKIDSANYGRTDSTTCSAGQIASGITKTDCYNTNTLALVKARCEGQTTCTLSATNSVFSDPCAKTYKYLDITYFCV